MKSIVVTISFLFIYLNLNSQKIYRWYQDGKIIFEISENTKSFKTVDGFVPDDQLPFANDLIEQFEIQ
jgi:hypothetical protein